MSEKTEVFEIIKSVITSQKGGVQLKDINRDYRNLAGGDIPFRDLGYRSIEEVLDHIPEVQSHVNNDGRLVFTNKGKNCEHLTKLISNQKGASGAKAKKLKEFSGGNNQNRRKPRHSDIGVIRNGYHKEEVNRDKVVEREHSRNWSGTDRKETWCKNNDIHKRGSESFPRMSTEQCDPNFSGGRGRCSKQVKNHFDQYPQVVHKDECPHNLAAEDRVYFFKTSKPLSKSESFHGMPRNDLREMGTFRTRDADQLSEDFDSAYWNRAFGTSFRTEKHTGSSNHINYRPGRGSSLLLDYPNPSYSNVGCTNPANGNHYEYPRYQKYRSSRSPDDWDKETCYGHKYGGRSEMSPRLNESYPSGHPGRKINVVSGSLRVTIRNC